MKPEFAPKAETILPAAPAKKESAPKDKSDEKLSPKDVVLKTLQLAKKIKHKK